MNSFQVPTDMSTVIFQNKDKEYFVRSRAIIEVLGNLKMPWSLFYYPMKMIPLFISDRIYSFIGRNRYQIFGKRLNKDENCCKFE